MTSVLFKQIKTRTMNKMSKVSLLQLMLFDFKLYIYSYLNPIRLFFLVFFSPERVAIWKACWIDKAFSSKMQTQLFHLYACIWAIHCIWYSTILCINMCISLLSKRGKNSRFFYEFCWYFCLRISVISFVLLNCLRLFFLYRMNFYKYIFFFETSFMQNKTYKSAISVVS